MLHPDLLHIAYDHRQELLREAARDHLADALPHPTSTPRVALSRLLRGLADALDPQSASAVGFRCRPDPEQILALPL